MALIDLFTKASENLSASRVYGEPCTVDGITVIPAAAFWGGSGGGGGHQSDGQDGEGGGFGVIARPVGAYVIKDGEVRWVPAIDITRTITAAAFAIWTIKRTLGAVRRSRQDS